VNSLKHRFVASDATNNPKDHSHSESDTMDQGTTNFAEADEELLNYDASDQLLEAASGMMDGKAANFTLSFCSGLDTCPS
jgi:hypothetical protein